MFSYRVTKPFSPTSDQKIIGWSKTMSAFNIHTNFFVLNLLKWYSNPFVCWKAIKDGSDVVPKKVMLIGKIFSLRKIDNITMDAHLTKIKNVVDQLEEIGMSLHEDIIVHLPNDMTLTCSKRCRLAMINFQLTRCLKPSYWAKRILKGLLQKTVERHL